MPLIPHLTLGILYPTRLAVGVTRCKRFSLIPDFTLSIIYVLNAWTLLAVGDTQDNVYMPLIQGFTPCITYPTRLAAGDTQGNVCLFIPGFTLWALSTQRIDTSCRW